MPYPKESVPTFPYPEESVPTFPYPEENETASQLTDRAFFKIHLNATILMYRGSSLDARAVLSGLSTFTLFMSVLTFHARRRSSFPCSFSPAKQAGDLPTAVY